MKNSSSAPTFDLHKLLEQFQQEQAQHAPSPLSVPQEHHQQTDLLDAAKVEIATSMASGNLTKAEQFVEFAWAIADSSKHAEHIALAHWCHALLLANRDIQGAIEQLDHALAFYRAEGRSEEEGRILPGYAHQLNLLGRLDEAEAAILQGIASLSNNPDYRDWPVVYLNAAYIQGQKGDYQTMRSSARHAEEKASEFAAKNPERADYYAILRASALVNQGLAALALADLPEAEVLLRSGLSIAEQQNSTEIVGRACLNLGRLATYRGQLFAALQWLSQSREAFIEAKIEIDEATVALEEAMLYSRLKMPERARQSALVAAQALAAAGIVAESVEAYLMVAQIAMDEKEPKRARRALDQLSSQISSAPPNLQHRYAGYAAHPLLITEESQIPQALDQLQSASKSLEKLGASHEALEIQLFEAELHQKAPASSGSNRTLDQLTTIVKQARKIGLPLLEHHALVRLAHYTQSAGPSASQISRLQALRRAADLIVDLRQQMQPEELKANLLTGYLPVYKALIQAQRQEQQFDAAVQTLLEAKGGLWHDLVHTAEASEPSKAWVKARAELTQWQEELRYANESGNAEAAYLALCQQKVTSAQYALGEAARSQPAQHAVHPLPTVAQLQQRLAPSTPILEYVVGETHISLCILTAEEEPRWLQLGETKVVQKLLARFSLLQVTLCNAPQTDGQRQHISNAQQASIDKLTRALYDELIRPAFPYISEAELLLIVPDDFLFELPWTALTLDTEPLGQRFDIGLLPSSAMLALDDGLRKQPLLTEGRLLGFAGDPPLTHLSPELEAIHQVLPNASVICPAASSALTWERPPSILHIAAHGIVSRRSPLLSSLQLADGPFLLADVLNLNLRGTLLVVLSACQTGSVPEKGGVLLALAGAFLCAGAQHVLATLWPVDDAATAIFMGAFYQHFSKHSSPPAALRHAQAAVRGSGYHHPFYWAGFQLIGRG